MAARQRKAGSSGRITPKGGPTPNRAAPAPVAGRRRPDPDEPVQVGRRPSSPRFLLFVAAMWVAVGIIMFFSLHTGWKLIPSIVAVGIGLMFLRGAGATVVRREQRDKPGR